MLEKMSVQLQWQQRERVEREQRRQPEQQQRQQQQWGSPCGTSSDC